MAVFFTQIYIYDNNKNIYILIYKKSLKKCLRLFNKTFSNCQATYQKELYLLFEKSGNFSQSEHRDSFDSSPPPVCFHLLFKDPLPPSTTNPLLKRVCWKRWKKLMIILVHSCIYIKNQINNGKKLLFKNLGESFTSES